MKFEILGKIENVEIIAISGLDVAVLKQMIENSPDAIMKLLKKSILDK